MKTGNYREQVNLLLKILPEISKERKLALHGGTAINLFIREMPRLSVDADLTYVPIEDRDNSMRGISDCLSSIAVNIKRVLPSVQIEHKAKEQKLLVNNNGVIVKVEVSVVNRGTIGLPEERQLCGMAQTLFDAFCVMNVVPIGQLYGGKVCAALDRQHPRDLFDVKYMLATEKFNENIKQGFLLLLHSSARSINEIIQPNLQNQQLALENQFAGMSEEVFTYEDYEATRNILIDAVQKSLTDYDKQFLLSFKNNTPDWSVYKFSQFPAVQWKLQNLQKLKADNPRKHALLYKKLETLLNVI